MFHSLGIHARLLLLALLPGSLITLLLGLFFVLHQLDAVHAQLDQRGRLLLEHLAPPLAGPLDAGQLSDLAQPLERILALEDVRAVRLLDAGGRPLLQAGARLDHAMPPLDAGRMTVEVRATSSCFVLPIRRPHDPRSGPPPAEQPLLGWLEIELTHQGALLDTYRSLLFGLLLALLCLLLALPLALHLASRIRQPLLTLAQGVEQLGQGHLETRLSHTGNPESDQLIDSLNRLASTLEAEREKWQQNVDQTTEELRESMETIEIQNIELDLARKEALTGSRAKSEFLVNMSHELRTPINGIIGFARLMQKTALDASQQGHLQTIDKSAQSLLKIIDGILEFSRIEAGMLTLETAPFNLAELLQDALELHAPEAHERHLELIGMVYRDVPHTLIGDELRLRQVLLNLIGNAIKFTEQGHVVVRAMLEEDLGERVQLRISVRDTGIGVPLEAQRNLFNAFTQVDSSRSRQRGGSGLGLAISKGFIEAMGGAIGINSVPGEGAEFWILLTLPRAEATPPPPVMFGGRALLLCEPHPLARQALQHALEDSGLKAQLCDTPETLAARVGEMHRAQGTDSAAPPPLVILGLDVQHATPEALEAPLQSLLRSGTRPLLLCPVTEMGRYRQHFSNPAILWLSKPVCPRKLQQALEQARQGMLLAPAERPAQPSGPAGTAPLLLCVDDHPINLRLVTTLLQGLGARVHTARSGREAVQAVQAQPFDLVLMDIQMPGMDGCAATAAIRRWEQQQGRPHTPIIALTAHALPEERRHLLQAGLDDYQTKPISEAQLIEVVQRWTGTSLPLQVTRGASRAQTDDSAPPASRPDEAAATFAVLDAEEGLRLAAGKPDLAAELLGMLLATLENEQQRLRAARSTGDRAALLEHVHRLHGATRYCGVPQLRACCQRCETLLKQDASDLDRDLDALDAAILRLRHESARTSH